MVVNQLDASLAALADPTRRAIVDRLRRGPATVGELAAPFDMSQQAVSKHLARLEQARLVRKTRRGRQHVCRLNAAPIKDVMDWAARYRRFWEESLDRLDDYLQELQARGPTEGDRDDRHD